MSLSSLAVKTTPPTSRAEALAECLTLTDQVNTLRSTWHLLEGAWEDRQTESNELAAGILAQASAREGRRLELLRYLRATKAQATPHPV